MTTSATWCKACGSTTITRGEPTIIRCSKCGRILAPTNPSGIKLLKEAYRWIDNKLQVEGRNQNLVRGRAIHPCVTYHPTFPSVREYLRSELINSAKTLSGKPLLLDHTESIPGIVISSAFEDNFVEFLARVDDKDVLEKIKNGTIKHCSVELGFEQLEKVNGVAPRGIRFTALSFVEKMRPGDPFSTVEVMQNG